MARYKLHELHIMCEERVHVFALLIVVNVSKRTVFPENIETRSIHVQNVEEGVSRHSQDKHLHSNSEQLAKQNKRRKKLSHCCC